MRAELRRQPCLRAELTGDINGSLVTDNEQDYYIFHAPAGTELNVSVTDTEDPRCSSTFQYPISCGNVSAELTDNQGNNVEGTDSSNPNNGITVPATFSHTLDTKGNCYLIVSGSLGTDANNNPASIPYQLSVSASPAVVWPAPAPYNVQRCTTKVYHRWLRRGRARHRHWVLVKYSATSCRTITIDP